MRTVRSGLVLAVVAALAAIPACTCSKGSSADVDAGAAASASATEDAQAPSNAGGMPGGISAPIAAARVENGDVIVAALDVSAKGLRVQRIAANDEIVGEKIVLDNLTWSSETELKMAPAGSGAAIVWHGNRNSKLVRQLVVIGADLIAKGEVLDIAPSSCATLDGMWSTDGIHLRSRPWLGRPAYGSLGKEQDLALSCGAHSAFAIIDEDTGTAVSVLNATYPPMPGMPDGGVRAVSPPAPDGGAAKPADAGANEAGVQVGAAIAMFAESEGAEDEQRERSDFTIGDDLGVVRLATSGAVSVREVRAGTPGPVHKLKTPIPREDDVVIVDASEKQIVVVFTRDASDTCGGDEGGMRASTKVLALRIDRTTWEETTLELSSGNCGREVGPFFTGAIGDVVSVAWLERVPVVGKSQAPIASLAHVRVPVVGGLPAPLARLDQAADALVDAGCDKERCYAVALARKPGADVMVPGFAKVLRY